MRRMRAIWLSLFLAAMAVSVPIARGQMQPSDGQQSKEPAPGKPRFVLKGAPRHEPPPPPQPLPGDKFAIEDADLVFEYQRPDGTVVHKRYELAIKVKPAVEVHFESLGPNLVRYTYTLTNEQGAKQPIELFAVGMSRPDLISNIQAPPGWRASGPSLASWGTPPRYNWYHDPAGAGLPAGSSAGPFSFDSPYLPGLTLLYIQGVEPKQTLGLRDIRSAWLHEQIGRATQFENNTLQPFAIGPRIAPGEGPQQAEGILQAVQVELLSVAGAGKFRGKEKAMLDIAGALPRADRGTVQSARLALEKMGETPFQSTFFKAMVFNLDQALSRMR